MAENKISLFTAVLININIMIGVGIFIVPSMMAQGANSLSFLGWILVAIIFLPVVLSIAKITNFFPGENSFFNYSNTVINKTAGFISGWAYFLGFSSICAIQLIGLRELLVNQIHLTILADNVLIFNIISIAVLCFLNFMNMSFISKIQNSATILKLLPLIFVILIMFFYWNPNMNFNFQDISKLKYAIPFALFGFWGFESSCNIAHMIGGDKKNVSRAILISFFAVVAIYTLFHFGLLLIMSPENLATHSASSFVRYLGIQNPHYVYLLNATISAAILISFISSIFGGFLSTSSNLHTMTMKNLFPFSSTLKKTNKYERPIYCITIMGITTFIFMTLINSKEILNSMCNFGLLTAFLLTIASLFILQLKNKFYGQILISLFAFLSCSFLIYYSWMLIAPTQTERFFYTLPLILFAALGLLLFKINESLLKKS
jgi:basic amino acid/polyamine antiporter, APA family